MNNKSASHSDFIFKTVTLIITIAGVALLCYTAITPSGNQNHGKMNGGFSTEKNSVITVTAMTLTPSGIENTIKINGDIASKSEVDVFPDTSGKITRIETAEGQHIAKGSVLMYVDPSKPGSAYAASPVKSPVSGTIIQIPVTVGSTITTNSTAAVIGSLNDLEVTVSVAEKYSSFLTIGEKAYITINSMPEIDFSAHVTSVSPVVNKITRTFTVKLELDKNDVRIKPGMFCAVRLVLQRADDVLVLPKTAISTYNAEPVAYVVDSENIAHRKNITCGMENDSHVLITSGLAAGETVVTAGSVTDGSTVRFAQQ